MTTKQLLDNYYAGLAEKRGWDEWISDDFKFVGGDMTKPDPIVGKDAYKTIVKRFSQLFSTMHLKQAIIAGDSACVIANYSYSFPNGKKISGDVAEIWKIKNDKLDALTIFFDTLTFQLNTK
jgi:ketosteroid isomerase-like protein